MEKGQIRKIVNKNIDCKSIKELLVKLIRAPARRRIGGLLGLKYFC